MCGGAWRESSLVMMVELDWDGEERRSGGRLELE